MQQARYFIAGSSLPAAIVTLLYVGRAYKRTAPSKRPFSFVEAAIGIPFLYGMFNVLALNTIHGQKIKRKRTAMAVFGALCGLTFATIGTRLGANKMFNLEGGQFPLAALLYAIIFAVGVYEVDKIMGLL